MSKDKVEAGDIWRHKTYNNLVHIIEVGENFISFIGQSDGVQSDYYCNSFNAHDFRFQYFFMTYSYLGKSKCSVKDLFKIDDTKIDKRKENGDS